jgi:uncharacterized membrane protein
MALPTRIGNHPIHPMLIPFPIALWIFSFVCDLIYALGWGGLVWTEMALYSMAGGILGGLAASVFGFGDYLSLTEATKIRVAKAHMVLNTGILILYAVNFIMRWGGNVAGTGPLVLSALALLLLGVSGWLGGELVYVHGVGVKPRSEPTAPKGKTTAA